MNEDKLKRIEALEVELAQLRAQLPAHSLKPEMLMKIEELEEELEKLKKEDR
jgi:hypothetical protein